MNELVNVYVEIEDGWKLLYKDIPEDIAIEIWKAGFKTGENKISIDDRTNREFFKRQINKLHQH